MPYFVDGNNLIGRARGASRPDEADREALIRELSARLRATRASVRLFFDGPSSRTTSLGGLSVPGAGGCADERILRELSGRHDPGEVTVVTADRELSRRVRDAGGKTLSPDEFWARFGTRGAPEAKLDGAKVDVDEWMDYFSDPKNRE